MIASFNRGYRAFQQSYRTCTPAADFLPPISCRGRQDRPRDHCAIRQLSVLRFLGRSNAFSGGTSSRINPSSRFDLACPGTMLTSPVSGTLRAAAIKNSMSIATQTPAAHDAMADHEQKRLALGYLQEAGGRQPRRHRRRLPGANLAFSGARRIDLDIRRGSHRPLCGKPGATRSQRRIFRRPVAAIAAAMMMARASAPRAAARN